MKTILLSILILAGAMYAPASAGPVRNVEVEFPRGRTGTILNGRIEGYEEVRYAVKARAGQQLSVMLDTDNLSAYFNIFAPGHKPGRDRAMFVGSISGKRFEAVLAAGGEYILQVYQMRSAARRGETARYNLSVQVTGQPSPGAPPAATNAPTGNGIDWPVDTDASGTLPCSGGEPSFRAQCPFRVKRNPYGATIWTVKPGTGTRLRVLYFEKDAFSSDDGTQIRANRQGDNWWVGAGAREYYLIPDAVIYGG